MQTNCPSGKCALGPPCVLELNAHGSGASTEDLQEQVQNPVASPISVPFQNNINFPLGAASRVQNILNIQPVIP